MSAAATTGGTLHLIIERPLTGLTSEDHLPVSGWAGHATGPCTVELHVDGARVASVLADGERPDLVAGVDLGPGGHAGPFRLDVDLSDRLPTWVDVELVARAPGGARAVVPLPCRREVPLPLTPARLASERPSVMFWLEGVRDGIADEWIRVAGGVVTRRRGETLVVIVDGERIPLATHPLARAPLGLTPHHPHTARGFRHTLDLRGRASDRVTLELELGGRTLGRAGILVDADRAGREALAVSDRPVAGRLRLARGLVVLPPGVRADDASAQAATAALRTQRGVAWVVPPEAVPGTQLPATLRAHLAAGPPDDAVPLVCCDPGDDLVPTAAAQLLDALVGASAAFADDVDATGRLLRRPWWSPELALGVDSTGGLVGLRAAYAAALAQDDATSVPALLAGAADAEDAVTRVPRALRRRTRADAAVVPLSRLMRVAAARGLTLETEAVAGPPGARRLRWRTAARPSVAVVIPSTGRPSLLGPVLRGLATATDADLEIVVVDSGSAAATVAALPDLPPVTVVPYDRDSFNFSRACNLGWRATSAPDVLFLNDDIDAPPGDWIARMAGWAAVPAVGLVGARLLTPDGSLQHDGVAIQLGGAIGFMANEVEHGRPRGSLGYGDLALLARDRTAVTGAAVLLSRATLELLDGWDEGMPIDYGDIDLCLRVRARLGLRVIVEPAAELVHHVSATRSRLGDLGDHRVFGRRWLTTLSREGDRWNHPAFALGSEHVLAP